MTPDFFNNELRTLYLKNELPRLVDRCKEILTDLRESHSSESPAAANVLENMAHAHNEMGELRKAIRATKEAIRIHLLQGDRNPEYIRGVCKLGALYTRLGLTAEAELSLDHALEVVESLPEDEQFQIADVLIGKARLHACHAEYAEAEQCLLDAAKRRLDDYNWLHPMFGIVYAFLSRLYWRMGRRFAAKRSMQKARRIYQNAGATDSVDHAMMLALLGEMEACQGNVADASASYRLALDILERLGLGRHARANAIEQQLLQLGTNAQSPSAGAARGRGG